MGLLTPFVVQAASPESVKAAVILNLARFTQWQDTSVEPDPYAVNNKFTLCILGEDTTMRDALFALQGRKVGEQSLLLRELGVNHDVALLRGPCNMLFVAKTDYLSAQRAIAMMEGHRVLVVGEMSGFADIGGGINLLLRDGKIHIQANLEILKNAGLRLDPRLLKLVEVVAQ